MYICVLLSGSDIRVGAGGYDWEQTAWWDDGPATWNCIPQDCQGHC